MPPPFGAQHPISLWMFSLAMERFCSTEVGRKTHGERPATGAFRTLGTLRPRMLGTCPGSPSSHADDVLRSCPFQHQPQKRKEGWPKGAASLSPKYSLEMQKAHIPAQKYGARKSGGGAGPRQGQFSEASPVIITHAAMRQTPEGTGGAAYRDTGTHEDDPLWPRKLLSLCSSQ